MTPLKESLSLTVKSKDFDFLRSLGKVMGSDFLMRYLFTGKDQSIKKFTRYIYLSAVVDV